MVSWATRQNKKSENVATKFIAYAVLKEKSYNISYISVTDR